MCTNSKIKTEIVLNLRKTAEEDVLTTCLLAKDEKLINKTCSDIAGWIVSNFEHNAVDDARFIVHTNGTIDVCFILMFQEKIKFKFLLINRIKRLISKAGCTLTQNYGYKIAKTVCKTQK